MGNVLLRHKREIRASRELLRLVCFKQKGQVFRRPPLRGKSRGEKTAQPLEFKFWLQTLAPPFQLWDPGQVMLPLQPQFPHLKWRDKYLPIYRVFPTIHDNICCLWHIVGTQEMVTMVIASMAFMTLNRLAASFSAFLPHTRLHPQASSYFQTSAHVVPSFWPTLDFLPYLKNSYLSFNAQAKMLPPLWNLVPKSSRTKSSYVPKIPWQALISAWN